MSLLLHLNPMTAKSLPLSSQYPKVYPFTQMVNRVHLNKFDPFYYKLKCETISEVLGHSFNNASFEEIMMNRAKEIKEKYDGKIYLMWSGGIDSSAALISILNQWNNYELERLNLILSYDSIREFRDLWNIFYPNFKGRMFSSYVHPEKYCKDGYIITGEHGDQIFGSDMIKKVVMMYGNEGIHKSWKEIMPSIYSSLFSELSKKEIDLFIQNTESTIDQCPFEIKSSFDWVWWFNFTNKWQHVKYRLLSYKTWETPEKSFKKIIHFYDTVDWQNWSLQNHDKKIENTLDSYKLAAKKYIVNCTGFSDYMKKPKIGSLRSVWANKNFYDAIDENFNYLTHQQSLEYIR